MRKFFLTTLLIAASVPALYGQGADALSFSRIDRNPVTAAFAGAGSASGERAAFTAFSNASVLPFTAEGTEAGISYQYWAPNTSKASHVNAGVACKITPRIALSLGYAFQGGQSYAILDDSGKADGNYSPHAHLAAFGLGIGLGSKVGIGLNARYALEKLAPANRVSGFSGDLFLAFQPLEGLRFTAGVSTLGTKVASGDGSAYAQPASFKVAGEGVLRFLDSHSLTVLADADYFFDGHLVAAAGLQYAWNGTVFLRGGYCMAGEGAVIPKHLGLGIGARLGSFRLDLSYLTASETLANTISAGVGYRF